MEVTAKKPSVLGRLFQNSVITSRDIRALIVPLVVNQFFVSILGMIDTAMISSSCSDIIVANGLYSSTYVMTNGLFGSVCVGGGVLMAQYVGKGDRKNIAQTLGQTYTMSVVISLFVVVISILFGKQYLSMLYPETDPEIIRMAYMQMFGYALSTPFLASFEATMTALRVLGNGRACFVITTTANAIYVFLNYILVVKSGTGIIGYCISIAALRIFTFFVSVYVLKRYYPELNLNLKSFIVFDTEKIKKILKVGVPICLEQLFLNLGSVVFSVIIAKCGTEAIKANAIVPSLIAIIDSLIVAIDSSTTPIIGRCVGAGKPKDARKLTYALMALAAGISVVLYSVYLPFYPVVLSTYSPSAEVAAMVPLLLFSYVGARILLGIPHTIGCSALKASGDSGYTSIVSLVGMWGVSIVLSYTLAIHFGWGLFGTYIATFAFWLFRTVFFIARINGKKWCRKKLV